MDSTAIRLRIKTLREAQKLTQAQLAAKMGLHVNTVGNLERGKTRLSEENIAKYAKALGVSDFYLMNGVEKTIVLGDDQTEYEKATMDALKEEIVYLKKLIENQEEKIQELKANLDRTLAEKAKVEEELAALRENR